MKSSLKHLAVCVLFIASLLCITAFAADTFTLSASETSITSDSGTSVITPSLTVNGSTVTNFEGIRYSISSVCVKPEANDDGTLTVIGRMDGSVSIGASFTYNGTTYTASPITVNVSEQYDRISAKKIKVVVFGNSITSHPTLDDWTSQGQGMAADSPSKDYIHIFTSQLEKKYGKGNVSLAIKSSVDFERAMDTATTTTDWTSFLAEKAAYVEAEQPDIIVLQMGENSFGSSVPNDYVNVFRNGVEYFVNIMKEKAPDTTVLLVSSTWGATVNGVIAAAKNLDVPYVRSDIIYALEGSKAKEDNYFGTNGGIGAHPGNIGHERMGLAAYESINLYLTTDLDADIIYSATPGAVEISGNNSITTDGGSVQLTAKVIPEEAVQDVVWSTSDKRVAVVDENGLVSAKSNGTVAITVVSAFDETVKGSVTLNISGQIDPYTLSYNKNATDTVSGMPEADNFAKGYTPLSSAYPERSTYTFLGWSLTPDGELVDSVNVKADTTVYAIWEKATRWYFDRPDYIDVREGLNFVDGFTTNAFHAEVENGQFTFMTTDPDGAGTVFTVNSPELDVETDNYSALVIKQKNTAVKNSTLKLVITSVNGEYTFEKKIPDTNYNDYVFDLAEVEGNIIGFVLYPTNLDTTVYIDSIEFVEKSEAAVLNFESFLYTGFSVDTVPVNAVDGTDYLISVGSKVLLYNDDYSENVLYKATENGFVNEDYYVVYDDLGYGSFALDNSVSDRADIFVAFYMPNGKIRKVIKATDIYDGRVYFITPNVFETVCAKAFIFDANKILKPLTKEKTLELYDVVNSSETNEDGDTPIDMGGFLDPENETLIDAGGILS